MVPMLAERQAETEQRTFYSEETHEAFKEAGFYLINHPRRYGGYEFGVETFYTVVAEIARGCPSSGWMFALGSGHTLAVAAYWNEQAQAELLGTNDYFICPATLKPQGFAKRVDGGWVINGTYNYCSGAPYANYYWGHAIPEGAEDGSPVMPIQFIIPRSEWTRLDDWGTTLGLRGSGSHSIQIENGFVPDHLVRENSSFMGLAPNGGSPGYHLHGNSVYNGSAISWFAMEAIALATGFAKGALDEYTRLMEAKQTPIPPLVPRSQDIDYQLWYGDAFGKVAMAEATLDGALKRMASLCERGEMTLEEDLRFVRLSREMSSYCWDVVANYFCRTAGSSEIRTGTRMERAWRDFCQMHSHNGFVFIGESVSRDLARVRFDLDAPPELRSLKAARDAAS
jgi:3-hydroxy-9,10-secoandrosta-1,3,5(10)-triene-9,17-dione monooxygenase